MEDLHRRFDREAVSKRTGLTRALLLMGILTGPLFFAVAIIQILTRPGYDIRVNAISQLSRGDLGGIQIASFVITGLLAVASAAVGFFISMLSALANCFVFVRRFATRGNRGWPTYCIICGAAAPVLIVLSMAVQSWAGVIVALAGAVVFGWVAAT